MAVTQTASERILDAAEMLFADRGYAAATMRDIAQEADVPVSLITHHFSTKEELFRQVIDRRIHEQVGVTLAEIATARVAAGNRPVDLEKLIRVYFEPMVERSASGDPGWKNYARLMGRAMTSRQYEQFMKPMISVYDTVHDAFAIEVRRNFPDADERRLHWAMYFLHATMLHVLVESGMVDRQSDGLCKSSELEAILDEMVPFYAAAFRQRLTPA